MEKKIEEAKRLYQTANDDQKYVLERLFPELKESEDEKIRKDLIKWIKEFPDSIWREHYTKDVIAWLENQGERKPIIDGILTATNYDKMFQNCNVHKFKVGDWIIFNEHHDSLYQVEKIQGLRYYLRHYLGGTFSVHFDNELIRQWNIADAKDGDVLVYNNGSVEIILLFKKWMDGVGKGAYSYVHTFNNKILFNDWSDCGYDTHPATKEQRDILFQKMKDSGYEWDAVKKELRKIEQKPTWSVDDTFKVQRICKYLDEVKKYYADITEVRECMDWLKSFKERME